MNFINCALNIFFYVILLSVPLSSQMALPTFHGAHKPHSSSSSSTNGPAIANGHLHSLVILENGTVKAFGRSNYGQLGQGITNHIGYNANEMGDNLSSIDLSSSSDKVLQ